MDQTNTHAQDPVDQLAEEFAERLRRGESPSVDDYAEKHPQFADEIRELFPALVEIEELAPRTRRPPHHSPSTFNPTHGGDGWIPPKHFGDFRIVREIGRGGMGVVYEANQESLRRHVALKVLPPSAIQNGAQRERFQREAQSAARLHHTNIVPVFAVGEENGLPFYAMQYIHGRGLHEILRVIQQRSSEIGRPDETDDLTDRLAAGLLSGVFAVATEPAARAAEIQSNDTADETHPHINHAANDALTAQPQMPADHCHSAMQGPYFRAVARIAIQVAEALSYAHSQGILHRDIKPSNLYLDTQGIAWVMDFGLAKAVGLPDLTETGTIAGTLRYLPPERFHDKADPRSDVYSLGLTLYELLALRPAFAATDRNRLLQQVMQAEPVSPRRINPRIPRDLETIALKCLRKDPQNRYATAKDLAEDLRRYLGGEPISARRPNFVQRGLMWIRRRPATAASLFLSVLTVISLAATLLVSSFYAQLRTVNNQLHTSLNAETESRKSAESARRRAESAEERIRRLHYNGNIMLAQRELQLGRGAHIRQLLADCPPDLRGWEWHYLRQKCFANSPVFRRLAGRDPAVALRPDGKQIALAFSSKNVRIVDSFTLKTVVEIKSLRNAPTSLAYSPDGKNLAGSLPAKKGGQDVCIWDGRSGKQLHRWSAGGDRLTFSPNGKYLAGRVDRSGHFAVWDATTGKKLLALDGLNTQVAFHPGGKLLAIATARDNSAHICDSQTGIPVRRLNGHADRLYAVAFSPDGKHLATASGDRTVRVWNVETGQSLSILKGHTFGAWSVAFSPSGKILVSGDRAGKIFVWDWRHGKLLHTLPGHERETTGLAWSPDGTFFVSTGRDQTARIWQIGGKRGRVHFAGNGPEGAAHKMYPSPFSESVSIQADAQRVVFSPNSEKLAVWRPDGRLEYWNSNTGTKLSAHSGHSLPSVTCAAADANGDRLASAAWDPTNKQTEVKVRNAKTGKVIATFKGIWGTINYLRFSADGKQIAATHLSIDPQMRTRTGSIKKDDKANADFCGVKIWDVQSGKPIFSRKEKSAHFMWSAISPDLRFLAGVRHDNTDDSWKTIQVWDRQNRKFVQELTDFHADASTVGFGPNNQYLAAHGIGRLVLWDWRTKVKVLDFEPLIGNKFFRGLVFTPDGQRLLVGRGSEWTIWDVVTGQPLLSIDESEADDLPNRIRQIAVSPDGRSIATVLSDETIKVRTLQSNLHHHKN